jgi:hypothetical protein
MFKGLSEKELKQRENEILFKAMERKWALDAAGVTPTHDKLFCLWKWQLGEIETEKVSRAA